jgi:stage III sporulation protein SpoIIIAA
MTSLSKERAELQAADELRLLLNALPPHIVEPLEQAEDLNDLLEIVLDLGRLPEARFPGRELTLSSREVSEEDLQYVVARIGVFGQDNRAGIPRTLHRISAIRNRNGKIVGLTCRVGRAVFGTIQIIRDIVELGQSILILGRPGVGKTTMLREVARVLADDLRKRVVIVDTSNEIGGDGDIPHPGIGRARRMQVPTPAEQHAVMIEAVENHMPEVIIIDEIGTELEAAAARTIAERGVQLIGTAHGTTLENLMANPTLSDLVGGIQAVTLSDEEARRRGTQKTVLERKAPPTFQILVEIQDWQRVVVHRSVADTVDAFLRGQPVVAELRLRNERGEVERREILVEPQAQRPQSSFEDTWRGRGPARSLPRSRELFEREWARERPRPRERVLPAYSMDELPTRAPETALAPAPVPERPSLRPMRLYPYGVNRDRLEQAIRELRVPATLVRNIDEADAVITLKNYYRKKPEPIRDAEERGVPVYVLKSNTIQQMLTALATLYNLESANPEALALQEAEDAINRVLETSQPVELAPASASVRRMQHALAERYNLASRSTGREPFRRVRIFKPGQEIPYE